MDRAKLNEGEVKEILMNVCPILLSITPFLDIPQQDTIMIRLQLMVAVAVKFLFFPHTLIF